MDWLRLYDEILHDRKVQALPCDLFKAWINLLCIANKGAPRGTLPPVEDVAWTLRMSEADTERALADLVAVGLIDQTAKGYQMHNWERRQYASDNSTERVQRFRQKHAETAGNVTETLQKQPSNENATPPEQKQIQNRTDTEAEAEHPAPVRLRAVPKQSEVIPPAAVAANAVEQAAESVLGRKLKSAERKAVTHWCNTDGRGVTPEIAEYAEVETATHTGGDNLRYFFSIMERVLIEPDRGKPEKGSKGGGTNGRYENTADRNARIGRELQRETSRLTEGHYLQGPRDSG